MVAERLYESWNNFVMNSEPAAYKPGDDKRAAAIASLYMGLANNGGINSFLTCSNDYDATEVLESLVAVGAMVAAKEFGFVLRTLGGPLPPASQRERFYQLERLWKKSLNKVDFVSEEADRDLMRALERHVEKYEQFYLALRTNPRTGRDWRDFEL